MYAYMLKDLLALLCADLGGPRAAPTSWKLWDMCT